jgi:hypothetical protein
MSSSDPNSTDAELLERYRRASEAEPIAPTQAVRAAIMAEARRIAAGQAAATPHQYFDTSQPAANQPRWKIAAVGTCGAALLAALLIAPHYWNKPAPPALASANAPASLAAPAPPGRAETGSAAQSKPVPQFVPSAGPSAKQAAASAERLAQTDNFAPHPSNGMSARSQASRSDAARAAAPQALGNRVPLQGAERSANPLLSAVAARDKDRIESLLDQGADVDQRDVAGRSALMLATLRGQVEIVQLLLSRGADPNAADTAGRTPVQQARVAHRSEIVSLLEAAGAQ